MLRKKRVIGRAFIQPVDRQPNDQAAGDKGGTAAAVAAGLLAVEASCKPGDTDASAADHSRGCERRRAAVRGPELAVPRVPSS